MSPEPVSQSEKSAASEPASITAEEAIAFFNLSKDALAIMDLKGNLLKTNPAHHEMLGVPVGCARILDYVHPDDRHIAEETFSKLASGEEHEPLDEVRCLTPEGTWRWMSWHGFVSPQHNRFFAIGRDVSARKFVETRLKQVASIVENSSDAIIGVDLERRVLTWNNGAVDLFGYRADEAVGMPVGNLFGAASADAIFGGTALRTHESTCRRKDATGFTGDVSVSVVKDDVDKEVGHSIIVRDVSERKEIERRVREFYSMVSHELRTPLTSIRASLGLLQSHTVDVSSAEGHELIDMARTSADRLVRLINDILDIQKIESGRMDMAAEQVVPSKIVELACAGVSGLAEPLDILLRVDVDAKDTIVRANKDRTIQVLTNLLSNAIKFSGANTVVRARTICGDGTVRFLVEDEGPGIAAAQAHKLFEKFQQLDSSDSRMHGGTGLGLAICKALVEEQGGRIGYFNNQDRGCTFWFDLPVWE